MPNQENSTQNLLRSIDLVLKRLETVGITVDQNINIDKVANTATASGTGVDTAGTLRVSLATNVPLPTGTNEIGNVKNSGTFVVQATLPSGTETPSATIVTDSTASPVAAGKLTVTFTTNSTFTGTILGATRNASTTYSFSVSNPGKTLAAIAYTVTAGSMIIDVIV